MQKIKKRTRERKEKEQIELLHCGLKNEHTLMLTWDERPEIPRKIKREIDGQTQEMYSKQNGEDWKAKELSIGQGCRDAELRRYNRPLRWRNSAARLRGLIRGRPLKYLLLGGRKIRLSNVVLPSVPKLFIFQTQVLQVKLSFCQVLGIHASDCGVCIKSSLSAEVN